ncbi:hypothetical protein NTE_02125 [Candidatus Nitrososphaera evergladensis SR1]|jgi:hypothetical protein|uniref:Uncharacterized protein n=1 Tax=Candidatus Nitrososphaera evergladensis SR1 TaxID=1459636 RepID=A0A075MSQ9_9ARCH|nr:hypothetical protein [Candidatus Nitrososphaera evergladensis]AIF84180.1 hypothetical protein NTE_02125 [Candidatus Nitrososphaera evergladensis SR1]
MSENDNVSITFRVDSRRVDQLRIIAAEQGMSLNLLVSHILSSYLEWESIAPKAGLAIVQKEVIKAFVNQMGDDELKKTAIKAADSFLETLLLMTGKKDVDSVLFVLRSKFKRSGFTIRSFEETDGRKILVQHDMGNKVSIFFKMYVERLINNAGSPVKIDTTDKSLIIEIPN